MDFITKKNILIQLQKELESINQERSLQLPNFIIDIDDSATRWGSWSKSKNTITLSEQLLNRFDWFVVLEIFKHEIAHAYEDIHFSVNTEDTSHGPQFQRACIRVGVDLWARKASINPTDISNLESRGSGQIPTVLRRIQKLLALSQSHHEHEAAEAIKKVRELSEKHHIEDIEACGNDYVDIAIDLGYKRLPQHAHEITSILINFYHVQVVQASIWNLPKQSTHQGLHLLGSRVNVTVAEYVFMFLWNQLPILWEQHQKRFSKNSRKLKKSFYHGILKGLYNKLDNERRSPHCQDTHKKSLIQVGEVRIQKYVKNRFPRLRRISASAQHIHTESFNAGERIGKSLEIRGGLKPQKSTQHQPRLHAPGERN